MTLDIDALKRDKRPQSAWVVHALIDLLEAAEKSDAESLAMYRKARDERDALRAEIAALVDDMNLLRDNNTSLRAALQHEADCLEAAKAEIDALRAKIEQMERQEPVAWTTKLALEYGASTLGFQISGVNMWGENGVPLYALPGAQAQPAPSAPDGVSFIDTSQFAGVVSTEIVHSYPQPSGWLRAINEALVVTHLGVANASDTYEQAKAKLDSLIGFHVDIATDPAVNGGWKLVPVEILDRFPEINQNNYNHDDVCNLNAWGVELVLAAAPEAKS